ncbi:uncharacterized protein Dvar_35490 [Desulfosarcina variabilis str. Montpellier]
MPKYLFAPAALEKETAVNEKKSPQPPSIFSNSDLLSDDDFLNRYFRPQNIDLILHSAPITHRF